MLEVDHIRRAFGKIQAVRDVEFSIESGTTFGLLGPNGAGKTTTMRMILGILEPDAGTIRWNGARVEGGSRKRFGYLPEERGIYGRMKVREQIQYFGKLHGLREPQLRTEADRWIERLRIEQYAQRPCSELSKGNQQKVQLACAAVHRPELLVLDEPFSGLDPVNAEVLLEILRDLQHTGTTLVLSSHQMWQLEELCDRFCVIDGGENKVGGTLAELRRAFPTRVVRVAPASDDAERILAAVPDSSRLDNANGVLDFGVPAATDFAALLRRLVETTAVTRFEAIEPSLHDIYLRAIGTRAA